MDLDSSSFTASQTVLFDGLTPATLTANPNPFHDGMTLTIQTATAVRVLAVLTDATSRPVRTQWFDVPASLSPSLEPYLPDSMYCGYRSTVKYTISS